MAVKAVSSGELDSVVDEEELEADKELSVEAGEGFEIFSSDEGGDKDSGLKIRLRATDGFKSLEGRKMEAMEKSVLGLGGVEFLGEYLEKSM